MYTAKVKPSGPVKVFTIVLRIKGGDAYEVPMQAPTRALAQFRVIRDLLGLHRSDVIVCEHYDGELVA